MASRRTKVRKSLLSLLVSYLRAGTTDTSGFSAVAGQGYPHFDDIWTFTIDGELYQITQYESFRQELPLGVTLQFSSDTPDPSKAMAQRWIVGVQVAIRAPIQFAGESDAQQIAQKVDEALWRVGGKLEIKDFDVFPAVGTSTFVEWQTVPRGVWQFRDTDDQFEEMTLDMEMAYRSPQSEW